MKNADQFKPIRVFSPENKNTWFSVLPEYGGCLNEFVVNGQDILMAATTHEEIQSRTVQSYSGAQLFPYPNRIKNASYIFKNNSYQLPKNDLPRDHSLHGLIYNQAFNVDKTDTRSGIVELSYFYRKDHLGFPYDALIKNRFQLKKNTLEISTIIENTGTNEFPFGHGWHPYFTTSAKVNNWQLQIQRSSYYPIDKDLIPTGDLKVSKNFVTLQKIGDQDLNHCFKLEKAGLSKITLLSPDRKKSITMTLRGYPFLQIYTPPDRKSIALEPQSCAPDALNNKIGLLYLKPKQQIELKFNITANLN